MDETEEKKRRNSHRKRSKKKKKSTRNSKINEVDINNNNINSNNNINNNNEINTKPNNMNNENPNSIAIQVISTYQEVSFMGTLSANYQKSVINRKSSCCCCSCGNGLKGNLIYLIVMTVITIALGLVCKFTSFTSMQEYKLLKELVYDNIKK